MLDWGRSDWLAVVPSVGVAGGVGSPVRVPEVTRQLLTNP